MRRKTQCLLAVVGCCLIAAACAVQFRPPTQYSAVNFPNQYRETFVHYATIDRIDGLVRDVYVLPAALESLRAGRSLPDGTVIVIEGYYAQEDANGQPLVDEQGHFLRGEPLEMVHVAEKRFDWSPDDFTSVARAGSWNFASYIYGTQARFNEDMNACFNCHNAESALPSNVYSMPLLLRYVREGQTQYFYCKLPERIAC